MTDYVLAEFKSQFARLEEIINRDDVEKLEVFLREERFILLVDDKQMQNLKQTTMNAELRGRERVIPVLVNDVFGSGTPQEGRLLVKFLGIDSTGDPSVFIQKEVFLIRHRYDYRWGPIEGEADVELALFQGTILNMLHSVKQWNILKCLTEPPHSWNVDLPYEYGWTVMQHHLSCDDYRGAVQLATFSNEVRPYPITFRIAPEAKQIRVPLEYLLWPQELRLIQPERMQSQFDELNKTAKSRIPTGDYGYGFEPISHQYNHFVLIYELLLANAELANYDITGDGRLLYDDIVVIDSTRMWPIGPVDENHIMDNSEWDSFLEMFETERKWDQFLEQASYRKRIFNTWKKHRFNTALPGSRAASESPFRWGPPLLKDLVRLAIRRCMVRHVEPSVFDWEETTQPNQAKLVRHLQLPEHLRDFMLFMDVSIRMRTQAVPPRIWESAITEKYGTGFKVQAVDGGFIPDSALLAEFTSQFARLEEIINQDDAEKLEVFLREERFILLVDEQQMQNIKQPTMNAELRGRERVIMLHSVKQWNILKYLTESPQSWNVDLPYEYGWTVMQHHLSCDDYRGAVQLATFSNEVRPYPITFRIAPEVKQIRVPLEYSLWPQEVRLIQPERMRSQFDELNKSAKSRIPTRDYGYEFEPMYDEYAHFALIYELLLANAELTNYDMTGDGRLPYDDIVAMDSTRMWPIRPVNQDDIMDHSGLDSFIEMFGTVRIWDQFLEQASFRKRIFNTWKEHRFNTASPESEAASGVPFRWGPLPLKDLVRVVIRRCMVRRVEPTVFDWKETTQPNQAKLVRDLQLPEHLRDFMLFMDVSIRMTTQTVPPTMWEYAVTAKYGTGFKVLAVNGGFIPDSALSIHRSGVPNGITVSAMSRSTWRIDPLDHERGN